MRIFPQFSMPSKPTVGLGVGLVSLTTLALGTILPRAEALTPKIGEIGDSLVIAHGTQELKPFAACYHVTPSNTGELNTSLAERATEIISTAGQTFEALVRKCTQVSPTDTLLAGGETKEQLPTSTLVGNLLEVRK